MGHRVLRETKDHKGHQDQEVKAVLLEQLEQPVSRVHPEPRE